MRSSVGVGGGGVWKEEGSDEMRRGIKGKWEEGGKCGVRWKE